MGERIISTLFQKPGAVQHMEEPKDGYYLDAGFVIIVAEKQISEVSSQTNSNQSSDNESRGGRIVMNKQEALK